RFREMYYWDSYFTMLGLEVSGKFNLIRAMVDNFAWQIEQFGYVPNGTRSYFLGRSQPPFFASMLRILQRCYPDEPVLNKYLNALKAEYAYWMSGADNLISPGASKHVVRFKNGSVLNRYFDENDTPRVEMYAEDVELADVSGREPKDFYRHIRAACESGWDFTCRWFADGKSLNTVNCADLIPPDLNALLFNMENTLAEAYLLAGDRNKSKGMQEAVENRRIAVDALCWDGAVGIYRDYNFVENKHTEVLSLATVSPLYFEMASKQQASVIADILEKQFLQPGGLPCTLIESGEQWDWPNGWAPLQWLAIVGLRNYGHHSLANEIKNRWISINLKVYEKTGKLVEKYNVLNIDAEGGGGEYPLQDGFGWTNGVLLKLLSEEK
ncbi:MAG: trehalase family glycosidase, partial [Calditrichota bacterium]